jgi:cytoskeletal protein RodZ
MKPQDELINRYTEAKAQLPDGLPQEPPNALHERIMQAAREQANAINSIASRAYSMPANSPNEHKNTIPTTDAANDSFWSIKAVASIAVMGLSALLWWQFEQGTPQEQEAAKTAQPSPAVVAQAPATTPATSPATTAPSEALSESARAEKNVSASVPKPVVKPAPAPITKQAAKPAEAPSAAPPLAAERSSTQDMATAPQIANAEAATTADTAERSATAKSAPPAQVSKRFSAEAQGPLSAPPTAAPPPPIDAPSARAAAAPMAVARPPLIAALQERDAAALRQALAQGASPNLRTPDGNPALTQAVIQRWSEGVRILLAAGADRNAKNLRSHTAADVAQELGDREIIELLKAAR